MKIIKLVFLLLILFNISCCVSPKEREEQQVKDTVHKFWKSVKDNNFDNYKNLMYDNENYLGAMMGEFNFLHKNYNKINPNDFLLKNIKVKDTVIMFAGNKQKYVQYTFKKENDSTHLIKPLIITLTFYKPIGFDKIYNGILLRNHIGWDKD